MPQDIPLEGSELLPFTPPSIAKVEGAPVFMLRAATTREKRFRRRLLSEEGAAYHDEEAMRLEILNALKTSLWGEEKFATHSQPLIDYWDTLDTFRAQKKDNPELEWSYDNEIEQAVMTLLRDVEMSWKPLGRMKADNIDFNELFRASTVAVVVKGWGKSFLATKETDRNYLTIECVDAMARELAKFDRIEPNLGQIAWLELVNACSGRMALEEDEEKNSESPLPSVMTPPLSTETTTSEADGKSLAPAVEPTPSIETPSDL